MLKRIHIYLFEPRIPVAFFSLFRIVLLGWYLVASLLKIHDEYLKVKISEFYNPVPMLAHFGITGIIPVEYYVPIIILMFISAVLAIEGRWAKYALPILVITAYVRMVTHLGFFKAANSDYVIHSKNILFFFLLLLATIPWKYHMPFVETFRQLHFMWKKRKISGPLMPNIIPLTFKLTLGVAYFGAVWVRMTKTKLGWLDGYTLQGNLLDSYLTLDIDLALWLATQFEACWWLSILVNFFEFTLIFLLFQPLSTVIGIIGVAIMHISVYLFLGVNFLTWHQLNLVIVIPDLMVVAFTWLAFRQKKSPKPGGDG